MGIKRGFPWNQRHGHHDAHSKDRADDDALRKLLGLWVDKATRAEPLPAGQRYASGGEQPPQPAPAKYLACPAREVPLAFGGDHPHDEPQGIGRRPDLRVDLVGIIIGHKGQEGPAQAQNPGGD
ncbi:hypothetical protein CFL01nite_19260 [Corynebacterium flavescens]|uniref:Uncharacterized protein n=1 Tax=Corynebacterium flavescens TaxID=28028 RepID=A0A1L7CPH6_CORFL|nr:hypothetical protein CFLV_11675 [Corynebacterium flavescens]GEB98431.1 hypothetical protein CFL01nite_19260 [Corynebacterium flavescens]